VSSIEEFRRKETLQVDEDVVATARCAAKRGQDGHAGEPISEGDREGPTKGEEEEREEETGQGEGKKEDTSDSGREKKCGHAISRNLWRENGKRKKLSRYKNASLYRARRTSTKMTIE
jgi:hypothetical protein